MGYIETEYIRYKGKGNHSVNELEKIIKQREYELYLIKSGDLVKNNGVLGDVIKCDKGYVFEKCDRWKSHVNGCNFCKK